VDHTNEEEDVRPFEDLSAVTYEEVLESQILGFAKTIVAV
jgi:hypothetical protein